jgi:transcription initiation factor TFIID subunit 2
MLSDYDRTWCAKLLTDLTKWTITAPFRVPVDPVRDGAPNYLSMIASPMDFQTMKRKLAASEYASVDAFVADIQLICDNAKRYNGPGSMYGLICDDIMAEVRRQCGDRPGSADEEWHRALSRAVQALADHLREAPADAAAAPPAAPPRLAGARLAPAQRDALAGIVGTARLEAIARGWPLLNAAARDGILAVLAESAAQ